MHESMAARARAAQLERLRTRRLFNSSTRAAGAFASADSVSRSKFGLDPYTAVEKGYAGIVKELIPEICGGDVKARAESIEIVGIESDSLGQTHTEEFTDGSALIRVSDSMMSGCGQMYGLMSLAAAPYGRNLKRAIAGWSRTQGNSDIDHRSTVLGATSLRYESIHQQVWARSAKLTTKGNVRSKYDDKFVGNRTHNAVMFILAHEMAHVLLGHTREKLEASEQAMTLAPKQLHAWELEADAWALGCIESIPLLMRRRSGGPVEGAVIALMAIQMNTEPLFIRAPESHPTASDRISELWSRSSYPSETLPFLSLVSDMVGHAGSVQTSLPVEWWDALLEAPEFDSSWHTEAYFRMIRGFDASATWSTSRIIDYLNSTSRDAHDGNDAAAGIDFERVERSVRALDGGRSISRALAGLGAYDIDSIVEPSTPLSVAGLIELLLDSAAFEHAVSLAEDADTDPTVARSICYLLAQQLRPRLSR